MFEKIAVGGEFIRLAAAAEASPKVQTNRCCLILLEAESLEPLRTIAPAAAAGKQANLAIASCGGTVAQAYGCFLIATEGGCLLYTSPSPRDGLLSRMPSSA